MWTGIELLYPLQDLRLQYPVLEAISDIISSRLFYLVLPIMIVFAFYWVIDKRKGEIIGLGCITAMTSAMTLKCGIAQPRPWELDPNIIRVEGTNANGLSCPSGHTTNTIASLIPAAILGKNRIFAMMMVILTSLVIISRLVLCVHTPLDILAGILLGAGSALAAWKLTDWADSDRRYHCVTLSITSLMTAMFLLTATIWDPGSLKILEYAGFFYGFMLGRTLDRMLLNYQVPDMEIKKKVSIYVLGSILAAIVLFVPMVLVPFLGASIGGFIMMVWGTYGFPYTITKLTANTKS